MLDYAMSTMPGKGFQLQELKNLMISAEGRPRVDICKSLCILRVSTTIVLILPYRPEGAAPFCRCQSGPDCNQHGLFTRFESYDCHEVIHVH